MNQEAIFLWKKKKSLYLRGTFVANDLCPYLEKGRKGLAKLLCEFA